MNAHTILMLSGPFLLLLAIPLWGRRVPPNRFYGVRTRATLADEALWYEVNARSGRDLALAAALFTIGGLVIERIGRAWVPEFRTLASAALLIAALAWVSVRCAQWNSRAAK
jgi:uncharacterized membrane protein